MFDKHNADQSVSPETMPSGSNATFLLPGTRLRHWHLLLLIMLVSYILRLVLVANGGQFYFPDEKRYHPATIVADKLFSGEFKSGLGYALQYRRHPGSTMAFLLPALIHRVTYEWSGRSEDEPWPDYWQDRADDYRISAIFLAIPSVLSIGLIYLVAREAGAGSAEALLAAFLLASSNAWFIYSRHLLPYDSSMFLALAALYVSLRLGAREATGAFLVGALLLCAFWVYTNHIFLVITIALLYLVGTFSNARGLFRRLSAMAAGAVVLLGPVLVYNYFVLDINVVKDMMWSASVIAQGTFEEGIVLPFLFFRDTEGGTALVWLAGLLLALRSFIKRRPNRRHRLTMWLAGTIILYGLMALVSSGLHIFVLYGRTVRTLAPFIVLASAFAFSPYLSRHGQKSAALFGLGTLLLALASFVPALELEFYQNVARRVSAEYGDLSLGTTFNYPAYPSVLKDPEADAARYLLLNADYFYPITERRPRPEGKVILQVLHTHNYRPLHYEGMTTEMRELIYRQPLHIWLIDTEAPIE